jgi:phage baseplate assembly protein W
MPYYLNSNQVKPTRDALYSDVDPTMGMHPKTKDLLVLEDTTAVRRSIQNLLSTARGERLFQPNIGASLRVLLFEPIDAITTFEMRDRILDTLRKHEPRIGSLFVDVVASADTNSYEVSIEFGLRVSGEKNKFRTVLERIR